MESSEQIQARHRKERKDLQSRITQKKKGATKKNRKGINSECEELERLLNERHRQEIAALNGDAVPDIDDVPELEESSLQDSELDAKLIGVNGVTQSLEETSLSEQTPSEDGQPRKRNRAKERLARRAAEQEAAVVEAKFDAANQTDQKTVERNKMLKEFKEQGLVEKTIKPDGHCLFSAVADQLSQAGIPLGAESELEQKDDQRYRLVRRAAARYIEEHPDIFAPFLEEPLEHYVDKIGDTAEWGGHLELLALAKTYNVEIGVIQEGGAQTIEPGSEGKSQPEKIWLAYYRHGFGLGEHYNSLRRAP